MNKLTTRVAIKHMFDESFKMTHLNGRFSPHKNFTEDLEEWCEKNKFDKEKWKAPALKLFRLREKYPNTPSKDIVNYVLSKEAYVLGCNK